MKYLISESKLDSFITNYIDKLFDVNDINSTNPYKYDDETGEEYEDETRVQFYIGDYSDEKACFTWYDCEYFVPFSDARELCPTVSLEYQYEKILNGYFGDIWKEPFRVWFIKNFNLPCKIVDN